MDIAVVHLSRILLLLLRHTHRSGQSNTGNGCKCCVYAGTVSPSPHPSMQQKAERVQRKQSTSSIEGEALLLLLRVQFRVVTSELLQLNEEVTKVKFEPIWVVIEDKQTLDECLYLGPAKSISTMSMKIKIVTYACKFGKAVCNKFPTNPPRKSLLLVPAGA